MPVMAYSPLGGAGASLLRDATLIRIDAAHGCSAAAGALAWTIRNRNVIAIPESGSVAHVRENAVAQTDPDTTGVYSTKMGPTAAEMMHLPGIRACI
jgi:diketogulonate reductase-like aldo/keto reductase